MHNYPKITRCVEIELKFNLELKLYALTYIILETVRSPITLACVDFLCNIDHFIFLIFYCWLQLLFFLFFFYFCCTCSLSYFFLWPCFARWNWSSFFFFYNPNITIMILNKFELYPKMELLFWNIISIHRPKEPRREINFALKWYWDRDIMKGITPSLQLVVEWKKSNYIQLIIE